MSLTTRELAEIISEDNGKSIEKNIEGIEAAARTYRLVFEQPGGPNEEGIWSDHDEAMLTMIVAVRAALAAGRTYRRRGAGGVRPTRTTAIEADYEAQRQDENSIRQIGTSTELGINSHTGTLHEEITHQLGEHAGEHDIDAIERDYRGAIGAVLPRGVWLSGDTLYSDRDDDLDLTDIRDTLDTIPASEDFWSIAEKHHQV